jgi:hypothetical protein
MINRMVLLIESVPLPDNHDNKFMSLVHVTQSSTSHILYSHHQQQ